jgi:hypothetical protein
MPTGPEHYAEAEKHLAIAAGIETDGDEDSASAWHQRQAQVHMLGALAAAIALPGRHPGDWEREIWAFGPGPGESDVTP